MIKKVEKRNFGVWCTVDVNSDCPCHTPLVRSNPGEQRRSRRRRRRRHVGVALKSCTCLIDFYRGY